MDAISWQWLVPVAILALCCLVPMFLMGRHGRHSGEAQRGDDRASSSENDHRRQGHKRV
jgi:hypothetical protein